MTAVGANRNTTIRHDIETPVKSISFQPENRKSATQTRKTASQPPNQARCLVGSLRLANGLKNTIEATTAEATPIARRSTRRRFGGATIRLEVGICARDHANATAYATRQEKWINACADWLDRASSVSGRSLGGRPRSSLGPPFRSSATCVPPWHSPPASQVARRNDGLRSSKSRKR